ncbi:MAG: tRNA uridine-5-carboxymethylaminomethyl(34) synthesis enzyme MnmG [Chitinivibrionia bacterium]|nr:tRNA uridine-5-carboxymethylaminomethyl(34) synthesis enzyme MnmG [Chitinivibrionia bacterium]
MEFDIIVIGAGHAGAEAASAAARLNSRVLLITGNIEFIGEMSCNPAIGGVAKGNIVREIDALGGVMARAADHAGIQFRMLNKSKGAAVWGPRCQTDRFLYRQFIREHLEHTSNITILQDMVGEILTNENGACGVITECGIKIKSKAVIITAGTFLNGVAHIAENKISCGRLGELASTKLSASIKKLGVKSARLKTGTSARIDKDTIDFSQLEIQKGDENPKPFSFSTDFPLNNSAVCYTIKTNHETHKIILDNIDQSPIYGTTKAITGAGPRYCPSIDDKIMRFGERDGHLLFVEPEGLNRREIYINGFSTSLPVDVQIKMLQSLQGFSAAKIIKPAYEIEYDYFDPTQLTLSLESKIIPNLYFAGQINGTSGYEEAAGQGIIAGINAALKTSEKSPFVLRRDEAYIGVLIDDLVSKGTHEPYRMFTARAEYRLILRQDNCDERIMPIAFELGLVSRETFEGRQKSWEKKEELKEKIRNTLVSADKWNAAGASAPLSHRSETETRSLSEAETTNKFLPIKENTRADKLLKRPNIELSDIVSNSNLDVSDYDEEVCLAAQSDILYEGFVLKQKEAIEKTLRYEDTKIPNTLNFNEIAGLSAESREKLNRHRPQTIGQSLRISGITPADVFVIIVYLSKKNENLEE